MPVEGAAETAIRLTDTRVAVLGTSDGAVWPSEPDARRALTISDGIGMRVADVASPGQRSIKGATHHSEAMVSRQLSSEARFAWSR